MERRILSHYRSSPTTGAARVPANEPAAPESPPTPAPAAAIPLAALRPAPPPVPEIGGRKDGPEPTRYGDWEKNGRCIDF